MESSLKNIALRLLQQDYRAFLVEGMDDEICLTALAVAVAHDQGHDEWLDDEIHPVWEAAELAASECESYILEQIERAAGCC